FAAPMKDATVYVDCRLSPALKGEGYAREIIRRLQEMRRQRDLRVEDFIAAEVVVHDERICSLIKSEWSDAIGREVRANHLTIRGVGDAVLARSWELQNEWDIDGVLVQTALSRLVDT
ncbi:MAG: DUF5915 domain-containing protein, partial [Methanomicrobiales archaeon]|nr:DUF5915 domain-containing protein [Methanomicrobiales archaeon]